MSVLRTGRGRAGGGGGGGEFLTEIKFGGGGGGVFFPTKLLFFKCSWGSETHAKKIKFGGGGILGCLRRPTRGRKTIHFFL